MQLDTDILDRMMDECKFTPDELREFNMKFWISKDYEFILDEYDGFDVIKTNLLTGEKIYFCTELRFLREFL
jgi:hypothetical protein